MPDTEGLSIEQIELLKDRGLSCAKLRQLENKEMRDSKNAYKQASKLRGLGFNSGAEMQEKVANAHKQLATTHNNLRKKVCGLK
jgi:hypothetical protein